MDNAELTNEQTEKVLQFQDLTGIEDINICRDVLSRHQWDLEVAFQEQLNIREGRPSMYASMTSEIRAPQVVNDRYLQHVFSNRRDGRGPPGGITSFIGYIINYVFNFAYSTFSSILSTLIGLFRTRETSKYIRFIKKLYNLLISRCFFLYFFFINFLFYSCNRSIRRCFNIY